MQPSGSPLLQKWKALLQSSNGSAQLWFKVRAFSVFFLLVWGNFFDLQKDSRSLNGCDNSLIVLCSLHIPEIFQCSHMLYIVLKTWPATQHLISVLVTAKSRGHVSVMTRSQLDLAHGVLKTIIKSKQICANLPQTSFSQGKIVNFQNFDLCVHILFWCCEKEKYWSLICFSCVRPQL